MNYNENYAIAGKSQIDDQPTKKKNGLNSKKVKIVFYFFFNQNQYKVIRIIFAVANFPFSTISAQNTIEIVPVFIVIQFIVIRLKVITLADCELWSESKQVGIRGGYQNFKSDADSCSTMRRLGFH